LTAQASTQVTIAGLVQAQDEWPFLAVSISHALMHHVDDVYVLNHASSDETHDGLLRLQRLWKGRIHAFDLRDDRLLQEASTNVLVELCNDESPDWIYVFDADEFLLTGRQASLRDVLGTVDSSYCAARYTVENWIAPREFDDSVLSDYEKLRYRSVPNVGFDLNPETCSDEIWHGNINFFDVPFSSKVVVRNDSELWVTGGAHFETGASRVAPARLRREEVRVAHLPFRSWSHLTRKVKHGEMLRRGGFPPQHGWQDQLIERFSNEGILHEFWESHSGPGRPGPSDRTHPTWTHDDALVQALEPVLDLLESELDLSPPHPGEAAFRAPGEPADTPIPFGVAVRTARKAQRVAGALRAERDALVTERDALVRKQDALARERDALLAELDAVAADRDAVRGEHDALTMDRDALERDRDALARERDALAEDRDAMLNSRTWRYSGFLRRLRVRYRRV
jgi:hypothetical protein